jgi:hypothetical protein
MPNPQQRKKLRDALISAFLDKRKLEEMLYFELDKQLNEIAQDSDLEYVVFQLIRRAEAEGWLVDLVQAACKERLRC